MAKKKRKNGFFKVTMISGIIAVLISLLIFNFFNTGYLGEIHSEIAGVGATLILVGIVYKLAKTKIG